MNTEELREAVKKARQEAFNSSKTLSEAKGNMFYGSILQGVAYCEEKWLKLEIQLLQAEVDENIKEKSNER